MSSFRGPQRPPSSSAVDDRHLLEKGNSRLYEIEANISRLFSCYLPLFSVSIVLIILMGAFALGLTGFTWHRVRHHLPGTGVIGYTHGIAVAKASGHNCARINNTANTAKRFDARCDNVFVRSIDGTCSTRELYYDAGSIRTATLENIENAPEFDQSVAVPNLRILSNLFFKGPEEIENSLNVSLWFTFFVEIEDMYVHAPLEITHSGATQAQLFASGNPLAVFDYACLKLTNTLPGGLVDPTDVFSPLVNPSISIPYLLSCDALHPTGSSCITENCFCTKSTHTPWIDMDDVVYSNNQTKLNAARTLVDGKLKMSTLSTGEEIPPTFAQTGNPIPFNGIALFSPPPNPATTADLAGTGGGASANVIVTASLFYREHNRLAAALKLENPSWSDEQLFQRARAWNIAQYQAIYVYEWLRVALGPLYESLFGAAYTGNKVAADAFIPTAFDSAIRSVHSSLYEDLDVVLPGPTTVTSLPAVLAVANPTGSIDLLNTVFGGSTAPFARSWIVQRANEMDSFYVEFLRTLLPPGSPAPALDLAASDIGRGRMDRVASYYHVRKHWRSDDLYTKPGCVASQVAGEADPLPCFLAISSNITVAATLQHVYRKVDTVDLHVGAMLENRHAGTFLPPTYAHVVAATLKKLREDDAFWFENTAPRFRQFTDAEIATIKTTRLMDIINRNTPLTCPFPPGVNSFMVVPDYAC